MFPFGIGGVYKIPRLRLCPPTLSFVLRAYTATSSSPVQHSSRPPFPPESDVSSAPPANAKQHTSLPTFLAHARRTSLSPTSTTYVGTVYEYTVLQALARFGLRLERTGGKDDRGVDLKGVWWVPDHEMVSGAEGAQNESAPHLNTTMASGKLISCVVQCKSLASSSSSPSSSPPFSQSPSSPSRPPKKAGPVFIRELEGAAPPGALALLATPTSATKGIRDALSRSYTPMAFVKCSTAGRIGQLVWNRAAGAGPGGDGNGMLSGFEGVGMRHFDAVDGEEAGEGVKEECVLFSRGGGPWDFLVADEGDVDDAAHEIGADVEDAGALFSPTKNAAADG